MPPNFALVSTLGPSLVSAQDVADLNTVAAYLRVAQTRVDRIPALLAAIQPTWPGGVVTNPLGTLQDIATAFNTPAGRPADEASFLDGLTTRVQATGLIHQDLLNRLAGRPPIQTFAALSGASAGDTARLETEAAFLDAASLVTVSLPLAISAIQSTWTPPPGDGTIFSLQEIASTLLPTPTTLRDMATKLRNVRSRVIATQSANQALANQLANPPTTTSPVLAPPLTRPAPTPAANNNVWWLLGGIAVAGIGVYAITRPAKNPLYPPLPTYTGRQTPEGGGWYVKVFSHQIGQDRYLKKIEGPFPTKDEAKQYADRQSPLETQVLYQSPYTRRVFGG